MPVRDADSAWAAQAGLRKKVADVFDGRDSALAYVRNLPGHDTTTAERFSAGAYFLPIVARSVEAFGGLVFAKTPTRTLPSGLEALTADITGSGQDIDRFAEQAFDGVLLTGAIAVLVDVQETAAGLTRAEASAIGVRSTLQLYAAGAILAARFRTFGPARKLAHVRLLEVVEEEDPADEFKLTAVEQVRVLDLDEAGLYRQRVFRPISGAWVQHGGTVEPTRAGQRLDYLPIYFSTPRDGEPSPAKPIVADLAEISIAHLNNSAALEWALLWTANPTPVFKGLIVADGEVIKLGSSEGISVSADGDAKFMEFTGAGLEELRLALEAKRKDAAMMGARMLLEQRGPQITAEQSRSERSGEISVIASVANAVSTCLTKALTELALWAGVSGEIEYWLNTDLNPAGLSPQMLAQYLAAWTSGALTEQELFALLQVHEIIDPAKTFEDHLAEQPDLVDDGEMEPALT